MGNAAANLTIGVYQTMTAGTQNQFLGGRGLNKQTATPADQSLNLFAASTTNTGGQTVTTSGTFPNCLYTRSAGSYLTDGLFVGQNVTWSGFVNGTNNQSCKITALTATVMTTNANTIVAETSTANAALTPPASAAYSPTVQLESSARLRDLPPITSPHRVLLRGRLLWWKAPSLHLAFDDPVLHVASPKQRSDKIPQEIQKQECAPDPRHPRYPPVAAGQPVDDCQNAHDDHVREHVPVEVKPSPHLIPNLTYIGAFAAFRVRGMSGHLESPFLSEEAHGDLDSVPPS